MKYSVLLHLLRFCTLATAELSDDAPNDSENDEEHNEENECEEGDDIDWMIHEDVEVSTSWDEVV